ncbi:uncharacterized protein DUF397 [Halopolyspora algeriensis]|uniref:Uncharacterized protein DUF397 n=1 Tax=Halopolyspora algeriensis TaxID=1500506 RepID=A0A368VWL3_9ACTN|nr:DUF397 domain-containing protein [Halopolyspora algeriensis]RCW46275.1 uncharacterized protein DUF397 [Halopolyspora algeriensis]TQM55677.1 uncharacterized protein DUF397 [Halopolyspora algeriensis]
MTPAHNPYPDVDDAQYEAVVHGDYTKSSFSSGNGGCLSLTRVGDHIGLQDDKLPEAERKARTHVYTREELRAFIDGAKAGEFDHLL